MHEFQAGEAISVVVILTNDLQKLNTRPLMITIIEPEKPLPTNITVKWPFVNPARVLVVRFTIRTRDSPKGSDVPQTIETTTPNFDARRHSVYRNLIHMLTFGSIEVTSRGCTSKRRD